MKVKKIGDFTIRINKYSDENCFFEISNSKGDSLFNNIHPRLAKEIEDTFRKIFKIKKISKNESL